MILFLNRQATSIRINNNKVNKVIDGEKKKIDCEM